MSAVVVGNATATSPGLVQLAGDFSGSATAPTVAAISGASPIVSTPSEIRWASGATPLIDQVAPASDLATKTLTIQGQAPFASASTNKAGGILALNIAPSVSGNVYGSVQVQYNATPIFQIQPYPGLPTVGCIYPGGVTPGATNYLVYTNASGTNLGINAASGGQCLFSVANNQVFAANASGMWVGSGVASLGGGVNVFGLSNATTAPTSNPTGGGILYENAGSLSHRDPTGTVKVITPASAGTVNTQAQQQFAFTQYGRISTSGNTLTLNIPLATSTTCCKLEVGGLIKIATAGSSNAVGDTFVDTKIATFKNVAGTVTQVGSAVDLSSSQSDASLSTSAISFSVSGTNIVVTLTATATAGTLGNADCTINAVQVVN